MVKVEYPLKQGLKQSTMVELTDLDMFQVKVEYPLKQGLKPASHL